MDGGHRVWPGRRDWALRGRRFLVFAATFLLTAAASYEMYQVLSVGTMTTLQMLFLVVFTMSFIWIALPFVSGLLGFIMLLCGRVASGLTAEPLASSLTLKSRNALLMPIYNEAPSRIFAAMQAMYESLEALGVLDHFDLFILSDTTDPNVWLDEELAFAALRRRTSGYHRIFYRHRPKNVRRKAGNIADFCTRWGAKYDHMIILDADSLMTGETLGAARRDDGSQSRSGAAANPAASRQPQYPVCPRPTICLPAVRPGHRRGGGVLAWRG